VISDEIDKIASKIVHAAFKVHKSLGPGLLETFYEICFCYELDKAGVRYKRQVPVPISYEGIAFDAAFRLDVFVEDLIICELKAVESMHPVFEAQLLSYLKLTNRNLGFLINFNVPLIKNGLKRMAL
jgi:GxxExxY protein